MKCNICPRGCDADRTGSSKNFGYCNMPENPVVARASLHLWEEPCISGKDGSGTIFFSGCSLKCVYCQNYNISSNGYGKEIDEKRLIEIFKELEDKGANNINLVNPTHFSEVLIRVLKKYKPSVPVVYNCSGYEKVETLKRFEGLIDIYLTDLKYVDSDVSKKYSGADDYFFYASRAIKEMIRQQPENTFGDKGIMKQGVIIRHLVLPCNLTQTKKVLQWIHNELPNNICISLMSQYIPCGKASEFKEINRKITKREYEKALSFMDELGFENGFIQELSSSDGCFIPPFNLEGI